MYTDYPQIRRYAEDLEGARRAYQDAQYDLTLAKRWLGQVSLWLGVQLVAWGQHLQAQPSIVRVGG